MEGLSKFITILPGGWGLANLLQYYNGGGVSRDPKFVLRNIWTAPKRFALLLGLVYYENALVFKIPNQN